MTISRKTYILDSSAILSYLDRESGYERMRQILNSHADGSADVVVASVHWGEVALKLIKRNGESVQQSIMAGLLELGIAVIPATGERAVRSAQLRARLSIPYVDTSGVELAAESTNHITNHIFVTADYDLKPAAAEVQIEFLPIK